MILYHGSDKVIEKPIYGFGRPDNDYGSGFYTTQDKEQANAWAANMGDSNSAYCNKYEIKETKMNILDLDKYGTLAWIAEITANRGIDDENTQTFAEELINTYRIARPKPCDIIKGYRADDSYMDVTNAFLLGQISIEDVNKFYKEGDLGEQYCLVSERAFNMLHFIEAKPVQDIEKYKNFDQQARKHVAKQLNQKILELVKTHGNVRGLSIFDVLDTKFYYNPKTGSYQKELPSDSEAELKGPKS